jgi:hypothetical protein
MAAKALDKKKHPLEFGKLDYLFKKYHRKLFLKDTKWPNNPRCRYPLHFLFLTYNFLISQPIRKTKYILDLSFGILSIFTSLQNGAIIQYGVFKNFSALLQLLVSLIMHHSNCYFRI